MAEFTEPRPARRHPALLGADIMITLARGCVRGPRPVADSLEGRARASHGPYGWLINRIMSLGAGVGAVQGPSARLFHVNPAGVSAAAFAPVQGGFGSWDGRNR